MGNISLRWARWYTARREQVEAAARACIQRAAAGGGFILAPGGGTNIDTPAANIDALVRATRP